MVQKPEKKFLLKDQLFNKERVAYIATRLSLAQSDFPAEAFIAEVIKDFPQLELKDRMMHLTRKINQYIKGDYQQQVRVLLSALPEPLDPDNTDDDFGEFIYGSFGYFISLYGCSRKNFRFSMKALYQITKRFTAEGPIRYFIDLDPDKSKEYLLKWACDTNHHVRRLASEGSRPSLPWAHKITVPFNYGGDILDILFSDRTRYVTRSVANHMNDISKTHPRWVVDRLSGWEDSNKQNTKEMDYIMRHSLRSLIKKGDPNALALLGYQYPPQNISMSLEDTPNRIYFGEKLIFGYCISSDTTQNIIIQYKLTYPRKKGKGNRVMSLKDTIITKEKIINGYVSYHFRPMSTRTYYPGDYTVTMIINGIEFESFSFVLGLR